MDQQFTQVKENKMLDANGKEFKSFTVGNGRFFIDNKEVPMYQYLEEKAKYENKVYRTVNNRGEIMHIVHWVIEYESGPVEYRRSGIVRWDVAQAQLTLYFDSTSVMVSETFDFEGKLIKFWTELDPIPEPITYQNMFEWWRD
jgi:hypothetical protein